MGKTYDALDTGVRDFIAAQYVFFVASAPLAAEGYVNLSPKGLDSFRVLGPRRVAYLDLTGSGAETAAHLRENGRITIMFCAFEGAPKILRLYGRGRTVEPDEPEWPELATHFPARAGARAIIDVAITRIADSCGYGVPRMQFEQERDQLGRWTERKGEDLAAYRVENNTRSIDGLPALRAAHDRSDRRG